jgi:hypothetical protein
MRRPVLTKPESDIVFFVALLVKMAATAEAPAARKRAQTRPPATAPQQAGRLRGAGLQDREWRIKSFIAGRATSAPGETPRTRPMRRTYPQAPVHPPAGA